MLDPRRLRVLGEVASRGSFSAAAAALSFTQSAVSQQVAALERETGTRLIERGVRPVRLADAGRALMAHAEAVLAHLDEAEQELGELAGLRRGRLRLAGFPTAVETLVPRAVARFHQRHPDVDLTVLDDHGQGLVPRLARWELDLALVYEHEALPEPDVELERTHLLDDPFDLAVPDGHPPGRPRLGRARGARRRDLDRRRPGQRLWRHRAPLLPGGRLRAPLRVRQRQLQRGAGLRRRWPGRRPPPPPGPHLHPPRAAPGAPQRPARAAHQRRPAGGQLPHRRHHLNAERAQGGRGRLDQARARRTRSASSRLKRSGSSRWGTCPTPSYQEASAVGQVARTCSAIASSTTVSARPWVTSRGTSSAASTSSQSSSRAARLARTWAGTSTIASQACRKAASR